MEKENYIMHNDISYKEFEIEESDIKKARFIYSVVKAIIPIYKYNSFSYKRKFANYKRLSKW